MRDMLPTRRSVAWLRSAAALFALATACGGRTPMSAIGTEPISDASVILDANGGGTGATSGGTGGTGAGGSGGSTVGSGGATGGSGGSTGGMGGAAPCADASPPIDLPGACNITCSATPCPVRCGEPRVVVSMPFEQQIMDIAVGADTLYFGTLPNQIQGGVYSVPLAGGAPPRQLVGDILVTELHLQGDTLYFVSKSRSGGAVLYGMPTTGGISTELHRAVDITNVTPDASGVYFKVHLSGPEPQILYRSRDGTGLRLVMALSPGSGGFAIDAGNLYVVERGRANAVFSLFQIALGPGTGTTLAESTDPISSPIATGSDVAFVQGTATPDTCRSAVMSVPRTGGPITRVSPGTSGADVMALARDETHLYWASTGSRGAVLRARKGQIPEIIAADQQGASRATLGPRDVYWIALRREMYEVRTVPK